MYTRREFLTALPSILIKERKFGHLIMLAAAFFLLTSGGFLPALIVLFLFLRKN